MSSLVKLSPARVKRLLEQFLEAADPRRAGLHPGREEHLLLVRSLVRPERLEKLDRTGLQALIGTLWAFRFWRNMESVLANALAAGLPSVRELLGDLLYGADTIVRRYDRLLASPLGFDTAAVSELLAVCEPESYAVRNISSRRGLFRLRAEELPLVTRGQITGSQYLAFCGELERLRRGLNEIEPVFKDLYDVDFFLYFVAYEALEEGESLGRLFVEAEGKLEPADIQLALLELGDGMGLGVWAGSGGLKNHRRRKGFKSLGRFLHELPTGEDELTERLLAEVDVVWFDGAKPVALFAVDSGEHLAEKLLCLADLMSRSEPFDAPVYIVAPDERWERVVSEATRPVFANLPRPLADCCRFLPASALAMIRQKLGDTVSRMTPGSLKKFSTAVE